MVSMTEGHAHCGGEGERDTAPRRFRHAGGGRMRRCAFYECNVAMQHEIASFSVKKLSKFERSSNACTNWC